MADTVLILGGIAFAGWEVPEKIPFGGRQQLVVHRLVGGEIVVDAMGPENGPIAWEGLFRGPDAAGRARALDALRQSGAQQILSWGGFFYTVVIEEFWADYERFYSCPYRIRCLVVSDGGGAATGPVATLDALVSADLAALAAGLAGAADPAAVATAAALAAAVPVAGTLAGAPASRLAPVMFAASQAASAFDAALIAQDGRVLAADAADPALLPGDAYAASALESLAAIAAEAALADGRALVGRIEANVSNELGA